MKFTKRLKEDFNIFDNIKIQALISILIVFISFIYYANDIISKAPNNIKLSVFDILIKPNGGGIVGDTLLGLPLVPIFAYLIITLLDFENNILNLIRIKSKISLWNKEILLVIKSSLIYSVIIVIGGYILSGIMLGNFKNTWANEDSILFNMIGNGEKWNNLTKLIKAPQILGLLFISIFLGLCTLGFIISLLRLKLKNIYVYIIIIVISFNDLLSYSRFSIILKHMTIGINNLLEPSSIILNWIYLILIMIGSYFLGKKLIPQKDFF